MEWINQLKIAVIEKDTDKLKKLVDNLPVLDNPKDIQMALHLIKEAKSVLVELRAETKNTMIKMKKNIDFLNATAPQQKAKFDTHF